MSLPKIYRCSYDDSSWYAIDGGETWDDKPATAFILSTAQRDQILEALRTGHAMYRALYSGDDCREIQKAIAILEDETVNDPRFTPQLPADNQKSEGNECEHEWFLSGPTMSRPQAEPRCKKCYAWKF